MDVHNGTTFDEMACLCSPSGATTATAILASVFAKYHKAYAKLRSQKNETKTPSESMKPLHLTLTDLEQGLALIFAGKFAALSRFANKPVAMEHTDQLNASKVPPVQKGNVERPKKVTFADEVGQTLTTIRKVSLNIFSQTDCLGLLGAVPEKARTKPSSWRLCFTQPCRNPAQMEKSLQKNHVTLESAVVRNDVHRLSGSIKVRNLPENVEKQVLIRYTTDRWRSARDQPAIFCGNDSNDDFYDLYDFDFSIPCGSDAFPFLEFKAGLIIYGVEFWDNNNGQGYFLISEHNSTVRLTCSEQAGEEDETGGQKAVSFNQPALVLV